RDFHVTGVQTCALPIFGFTNAWVWLWIQLNPYNHQVNVIGEHRFFQRDTEDIAKNEFKDHPLTQKLSAIYVDPAGPDDARILTRSEERRVGKECRARR